MSPRPALAYGTNPLPIELPRNATVVAAPANPACDPLPQLLERALAEPVGPALSELVAGRRRVMVIVSDATRADPRAAFLDALREPLRGREVQVAIANGTHPPRPIGELGLPSWVGDVLNHDARDPSNIVEIGQTSRGTPLRVNRALLDADLVIATGCIRPHYFAGYGAGVKALFPGLGENRAIRQNHQLKTEPNARAGRVDDNPCRLDLEEILDALPTPTFLLNAVQAPRGALFDAVAGSVREAFRMGAQRCRAVSTVTAPRADVVVVSDRLPVTASLYQASKLVAAVASLVQPGGRVVLAAECPEGVGGGTDGVRVVNDAIYEIGLRPRLPADHRIALVSSLSREVVASTYCEWATLETALADARAPVVVPSAAGSLLIQAE